MKPRLHLVEERERREVYLPPSRDITYPASVVLFCIVAGIITLGAAMVMAVLERWP